jgi:hypothetical protein
MIRYAAFLASGAGLEISTLAADVEFGVFREDCYLVSRRFASTRVSSIEPSKQTLQANDLSLSSSGGTSMFFTACRGHLRYLLYFRHSLSCFPIENW